MPIELIEMCLLAACELEDEDVTPASFKLQAAHKRVPGLIRRPKDTRLRLVIRSALPKLNAALFGTVFLAKPEHWTWFFGIEGIIDGGIVPENGKRHLVRQAVIVFDASQQLLPFVESSISDPALLEPSMWSVRNELGLQLNQKLTRVARVVFVAFNEALAGPREVGRVSPRDWCEGNVRLCRQLAQRAVAFRRSGDPVPFYPRQVWMNGIHDLHRSAIRTLILHGKGTTTVIGPLSELTKDLYLLYRGDEPLREPPSLIITSHVDWLDKRSYRRVLDAETPWLLQLTDQLSRNALVKCLQGRPTLWNAASWRWRFIDDEGRITKVSVTFQRDLSRPV